VSDLTDWRQAPVPVAELAPIDLPDDSYFEYARQDGTAGRPRGRVLRWRVPACVSLCRGPNDRFDGVLLENQHLKPHHSG